MLANKKLFTTTLGTCIGTLNWSVEEKIRVWWMRWCTIVPNSYQTRTQHDHTSLEKCRIYTNQDHPASRSCCYVIWICDNIWIWGQILGQFWAGIDFGRTRSLLHPTPVYPILALITNINGIFKFYRNWHSWYHWKAVNEYGSIEVFIIFRPMVRGVVKFWVIFCSWNFNIYIYIYIFKISLSELEFHTTKLL
jgi:hypothetical protein